MPLNGMAWQSGVCSGDDATPTQSMLIGFAPMFSVATTACTKTNGQSMIGILGYTYRPDGASEDTSVELGWQELGGINPFPSMWNASMTSVTAQVFAYPDSDGVGMVTVYFW